MYSTLEWWAVVATGRNIKETRSIVRLNRIAFSGLGGHCQKAAATAVDLFRMTDIFGRALSVVLDDVELER